MDSDYLEERPGVADAREPRLTITAIFRTLHTYRLQIVLTTVAVALAYLLGSVVYVLRSPAERYTTLGFRLEFTGAEIGQYPNGLKFSGSEIIDTTVLRAAFDANELDQYMSFSDFSRSVIVLEANAAAEQLAREYEAKLDNPRLSAVERERLEAEYIQKRDSLRKNEYSLTLTTREGIKKVPSPVASKTLADILRFWADFAAQSRQVLEHRVPLISGESVARLVDDQELFASLLALRTTSLELTANIDALSKLPGAEVVRSSGRRASIRELELELVMVERAGIEFLLTDLMGSGVIDRRHAASLIEAQLAFDRRTLASAEERVAILRAALLDYVRDRGVVPSSATLAASAAEPDSVVLSDTFIQRVVDLAQDAADRSYRQRQVEDIKQAALSVVPIRSAVEYQESLLAELASGSGGGRVTDYEAERNRLARRLATIATDLIEIRAILSRSLTAPGQMYAVTNPAVSMIGRSVSTSRLILGGFLAVSFALIAAIAGAFLHRTLITESGERLSDH